FGAIAASASAARRAATIRAGRILVAGGNEDSNARRYRLLEGGIERCIEGWAGQSLCLAIAHADDVDIVSAGVVQSVLDGGQTAKSAAGAGTRCTHNIRASSCSSSPLDINRCFHI